jgi:hypothetical protein
MPRVAPLIGSVSNLSLAEDAFIADSESNPYQEIYPVVGFAAADVVSRHWNVSIVPSG